MHRSRYLSATSHEMAVSVRVGEASTARCVGINWDASDVHLGCFNETLMAIDGKLTTPKAAMTGDSLEQCALACGSGDQVFAVRESAATGDSSCRCFPSATVMEEKYKVLDMYCRHPCRADPSQLCGGEFPPPSDSVLPVTRCSTVDVDDSPDANSKTVTVDPSKLVGRMCPGTVNSTNWLGGSTWGGSFTITQTDTTVTATRADITNGATEAQPWSHNLRFECCVPEEGLGAALHNLIKTKADYLSVYKKPATLSSAAPSAPCNFKWASAATPTLTSASPTTTTPGAMLTLAGTGLVASGDSPEPPVVSVCGGQTCKHVSASATEIKCRVPDCPAGYTTPVVVHVPPSGYAKHPSSALALKGTLSVSRVLHASNRSADGPGVVSGSAAGGVALVIEGNGFANDAARMTVELVAASGANAGDVLGTCQVTSTSPASGEIACTTQPVSNPLTNAGTLCSIKVTAKDESASSSVSSDTLASSYQLLPCAVRGRTKLRRRCHHTRHPISRAPPPPLGC